MVGGGGEEATALGILEALDDRVREQHRLVVPARIEGRLVERDQRRQQERVVIEVCADPAVAVLPGAQQATLVVAQLRQQERRASDRGVDVVGALERRAGLGQRRDHQRVPRGQALVVEARPHALRARAVQQAADLGQPVGLGSATLEHVGAVLEVA